MGTMAAFYSRNPLAGGSLVGTIGLDGYPSNMLRLARAKSYEAWRAGLRAVKANNGRYWWTPDRVWWTWPSTGMFVHDYSYWWDDAEGGVMVAHFQAGPVRLTEEVACNSRAWPECLSRHDANPALIGVPVPEFFATVDPWNLPAGRLHCRNSVHAFPEANEAGAEPLFAGFGGADLVLERDIAGRGVGQEFGAAAFHVHMGAGWTLSGTRLVQAVWNFGVNCHHAGKLGPRDDMQRGCHFLYSVEDFLRECRIGAVRISRLDTGRRFTVEADHPVSGAIRGEDDTLAKALVLARRQLLAAPGFRLLDTPPYETETRAARTSLAATQEAT